MKTFFSLPSSIKENKIIHECQTSTLKSLAFLLLWHEYTPTSVLAMFVPSFCHLSSCPDCAVSLLFAKVLALRVLLFFFSCRGAASPLPLPVLVLMLRFACSSSFSCSSCHKFRKSKLVMNGPLISRPLILACQDTTFRFIACQEYLDRYYLVVVVTL